MTVARSNLCFFFPREILATWSTRLGVCGPQGKPLDIDVSTAEAD